MSCTISDQVHLCTLCYSVCFVQSDNLPNLLHSSGNTYKEDSMDLVDDAHPAIKRSSDEGGACVYTRHS